MAGISVLNQPRISARTFARRLWSYHGQDTSEFSYAATVSIWVRWAFLIACIVETNYRIEYGSLSHILNTLYILAIMVPTAYVRWRIHTVGMVDMRWILFLSVIDAVAVAFTHSLSGGFDSPYFAMYYLQIALFAWVFTSPYLVLSWTTLIAAVYVSVCLVAGDGIDFGLQEEKELFYRLLAMYGVAASVNMITRFERVRRVRAVERERELNRQRIEMSQTIHDTTAQSAYMLGLGLEDAIERTDRSDPELAGKLEALWVLSRSTMWALRQPIDGGQIFSGGKLNEVLAAHADTFTVIASIQAELVQHGDEPQLSTITRSLLFSIAHNALTNAFRHSEAESVTISLDYRGDSLRLSMSDDGGGLPADYAERGHGFRNMRADAERLGGELEVESDETGTTITCTVPYGQKKEGM